MASGLYMTLLFGLVPLPAPKPVIDALTSVQVTVSATGQSGFELGFTISDRSVLQTLFLLASGSPLQIRVVIIATVNNFPQVLMDGVLLHQEMQPAGDSGHSTLTVKGTDLSALMDLISLDGLPYPAMPPEVRVATMLAKYAVFGIIPEVVPTIMPDIPIPVERIPTQKGTDLAYINSLAEDAGYVFYLDPGPLPGMNQAYWGPQIKFGIPQPALSVNMDTWSNVESLHFTYEPDKSVLPVVFIQDQLTKMVLPLPIPPVTPLNPPLGVFVPPPQKIEFMQDNAKLGPAQAILRGMARASNSADVVSGSGSLDVMRYGRVLKARQLVGVRGAGPAFDGLHYVDSVTHNIARGQYKQSFTLKRNALISNTPVVPTIGF
jgi:hypothetical protein